MEEQKLTIKDIVGLALKGWSKDDIKELFELAKSKEVPTEDGEQKTAVEDQPKAEPEEGNEPVKENKASGGGAGEESVDIKSLQAELKAVKEQLKAAQTANNNADLSGNTDNKTDDEILNDLARSFM